MKSPLASETLAFSEVAYTGILIAAMLQEIFRRPSLPEVFSKTDNTSFVEILKSSNLWCLRVDVARLKEINEKKEIHSE